MYRHVQTIESSENLPLNKQIKDFMEKFKINQRQDIIQEYYLVAGSVVEAYFMIIFCFGGIEIVEKLKNANQKSKTNTNMSDSLGKLEQILKHQCKWEKNMNSTKVFEANSKIFSKNYKFLVDEFIENINENVAENLYKSCCRQSQYLSGARIRQFKKGEYYQRANRRQNRRQNQQQEAQRFPGDNYLIVSQSTNFYIVGVFRTSEDYETEHTVMNDSSKKSEREEKNNIQKEIKVDEIKIKQTNSLYTQIPKYKVKSSEEVGKINKGSECCCCCCGSCSCSIM